MGVIHRVTQGLGRAIRPTRPELAAHLAGLLTGAYHFNTGNTTSGLVNHFFDATEPDANMTMALDFEDNRASQMSLSQGV